MNLIALIFVAALATPTPSQMHSGFMPSHHSSMKIHSMMKTHPMMKSHSMMKSHGKMKSHAMMKTHMPRRPSKP